MTRRSRLLFVTAFAIIIGACGDASDTLEFPFDQEPTTVIVEVGRGDVTVTENNERGTSIEATLSYEDTAPAVTADLSDGILRVSDNCVTGCSVDYRILVGDTADVTLVNGEGDIVITGLEGTFDIAGSGTGDVGLNSLTGSITVAIESGDILGARLVSETAQFATGDGAVDVTFDQVPTNLSVASGSGDVTAQVPDVPYLVDAATADGAVDVQVDVDAASERAIVIGTDSGDVTLYKK